MKHVSLAEARASIFDLLDEVERGVDLRISREGAPTAPTIPFDEGKREQAYQALRELREMRKTAAKGSVDGSATPAHYGRSLYAMSGESE